MRELEQDEIPACPTAHTGEGEKDRFLKRLASAGGSSSNVCVPCSAGKYYGSGGALAWRGRKRDGDGETVKGLNPFSFPDTVA